MAKKLFIKTYGCRMNVYDSARMADVLAPLGYGPADRAEDADMVIVNTCHIREKAAEKLFSDLGQLRLIKERRGLLVGVAGCVAQAEGDEIRRRAPFVDMVFGPQSYHRLPEMVARLGRAGGVVETEFPVEPKFDHLPRTAGDGSPAAFLTVQEGCDKFCTFCVVPYTRGAEYSRPVEGIEAEARRLVGGGAREITLLGQNVNAYHGAGPGGEWGLARLLRHLARIPGLERLRYMTSHPADLDQALIEAHRDEPKLMPFVHLPVQSGSDRMLRAMNRNYRAEDFRSLVEALRRARPDLALSSDFIVGFPGESDADFAATMALIENIGFAQAYSFKYSARPGTPAARQEDQVPETVKSERLGAVQALLASQQRRFNEASVGATMDVLLERPGRYPGQLVGRSPYMQAVHLRAPGARPGDILGARILAVHANSLAAEAARRAQSA